MLSNYDIILFESDNTLYDQVIHEQTAIFEAFEIDDLKKLLRS